jgi:hypothetical protein
MPRRSCPLILVALALAAGPASADAGFAPLPDKQAYLLQNPAEGKVSDEPLAVASGDVNGDGRIDLVVPASEADDGSGKLHVFLGDGGGRFAQSAGSPFQAARGGTAIALTDWSGDAVLDAIVSNEILPQTALADGLAVLHPGAGNGAFGTPNGEGTGGDSSVGLAIGQFGGDARPDIAVADRFTAAGAAPGRVAVLEANGPGTFVSPAHVYPLGAGVDPRSLASGDFNGDGRLDLATGNESGSVSVLLQQADGSFVSAPGVASGTTSLRSLVTTDVDGDGVLDLAAAAATMPGRVAVLRGNGSGGFAAVPGSPFATGANNARTVVAADLDGDGRVDLAATNNQNPGSVAVLAGNGAGGFAHAPGSPFPTGIVELPAGLTVADFDGDAQPDIATVHSENAARMVVQLNDLTPSARLGPGPLEFGTRAVRSPGAVLSATLTNDGPGFVRALPATVAGDGFSVAADGCAGRALVVGSSCSVDVRFSPTRLGAQSALLSVAPAGAVAPLTLALQGRGRRPQVSRLRVSPKRFRVARRATPVAAVPAGTSFRFTVAEQGRAKLTIQRAAAGRRVGSRCQKPRPRRRVRKRCTRWVSTGIGLRRTAAAGANRVRFTGRTRRRRLRPGAHRVRVVVRDPGGFASPARTARFRVVRR